MKMGIQDTIIKHRSIVGFATYGLAALVLFGFLEGTTLPKGIKIEWVATAGLALNFYLFNKHTAPSIQRLPPQTSYPPTAVYPQMIPQPEPERYPPRPDYYNPQPQQKRIPPRQVPRPKYDANKAYNTPPQEIELVKELLPKTPEELYDIPDLAEGITTMAEIHRAREQKRKEYASQQENFNKTSKEVSESLKGKSVEDEFPH